MSSSYNKPEEIMNITVENGAKKAALPVRTSAILGFQAGAFIALGYLLSIRITAPLTGDIAGLGSILGATVFPIGLILTLIAGGELLTGNMMAVPLAGLARKVSLRGILQNWAIITVANFMGALFVAYAFGHVAGLTADGIYLAKTISIAEHKLDDTFLQAFVSGIGCNWLVAAAVWLSYGAKDIIGKIAGIWFPTMTFVAIGFQHVVANMFVIPAAIFEGHFTWSQYFANFVPVFLGNATGGAVFVAMAYWFAYNKLQQKPKLEPAPSVIMLKRSKG
ncbi:formate/nitrite transporter family protein [Neobacillus notoginsengisoli]|uniref:Formate/nitrite transporter family protein n=1 Tax=Neobacillus notoginsengisoli TaxID=1578198 RepID=A0A417YY62_9BACI|nr:formate/nitrite transporter family protein [Neobacillus notoginsengisoli]RHW42573.1 formate/nitrite transporter family protein [Neobacillus notoginsengisoli]